MLPWLGTLHVSLCLVRTNKSLTREFWVAELVLFVQRKIRWGQLHTDCWVHQDEAAGVKETLDLKRVYNCIVHQLHRRRPRLRKAERLLIFFFFKIFLIVTCRFPKISCKKISVKWNDAKHIQHNLHCARSRPAFWEEWLHLWKSVFYPNFNPATICSGTVRERDLHPGEGMEGELFKCAGLPCAPSASKSRVMVIATEEKIKPTIFKREHASRQMLRSLRDVSAATSRSESSWRESARLRPDPICWICERWCWWCLGKQLYVPG